MLRRCIETPDRCGVVTPRRSSLSPVLSPAGWYPMPDSPSAACPFCRQLCCCLKGLKSSRDTKRLLRYGYTRCLLPISCQDYLSQIHGSRGFRTYVPAVPFDAIFLAVAFQRANCTFSSQQAQSLDCTISLDLRARAKLCDSHRVCRSAFDGRQSSQPAAHLHPA